MSNVRLAFALPAGFACVALATHRPAVAQCSSASPTAASAGSGWTDTWFQIVAFYRPRALDAAIRDHVAARVFPALASHP